MTAIDRLEIEMWNSCVLQRPIDDPKAVQDVFDRWSTDELAHIRERFLVLPVQTEHMTLIQEAIAQWNEREKKGLQRIGMSKNDFLQRFELGRQNFLTGNLNWMVHVISVGIKLDGVVRNMDWVNLFSWVLPQSDAKCANEHRQMGKMVAAFFYCELLAKYGNSGPGHDALRRIEARWLLANFEQ